MIERNFITQSSLAQRQPNADKAPDGRLITADFSVFHSSSDNRDHFIDPETVAQENEDYLKGVEAGKAEAQSVYESTIQIMEQTLESLKTAYSLQTSEIEASHARVISKCLEAVLPEIARQVLLSEMKTIIEKAAEAELRGQLTVKIHPDNKTANDFLQQRNLDNLRIVETEEVGSSAVSFSWDKSRVDINPEMAANRCLTLLAGQIGTTLPVEPSTKPVNQEA